MAVATVEQGNGTSPSGRMLQIRCETVTPHRYSVSPNRGDLEASGVLTDMIGLAVKQRDKSGRKS